MPVQLKYDPDLTYSDEDRPGKWKGATRDGTRTALMSCPVCAGVASLSNHTIDEAGKVSPSLVCPFRGCSFHDYVTLEGWKP